MRMRGDRKPQLALRGHPDAGLQPERTSLAWGRTIVSLFVASAILLRWVPHFGLWIAPTVCVLWIGAIAVLLTQKRRYRRSVAGIASEAFSASTGAIFALTAVVLGVGVMSIAVVAFDG